VKPKLVQLNEVAPVPAGPETLAVPVHRRPPPACGAEIVNVPVKLVETTLPVIVPFQSGLTAAQVPVTVPPDWSRLMKIATGCQLLDSRLPVQTPDTCAKFDGAFGLFVQPVRRMMLADFGDDAVVLRRQAQKVVRRTAKRSKRQLSPEGRARLVAALKKRWAKVRREKAAKTS
jgi:hypothetical protein